MTRLLHIAFTFQGGERTKELEPVFGKSLDWIRYAPNCWIVRTRLSPKQWMGRLKPYLSTGDWALIVAVDVKQRAGWLPGWVWDWIKKNGDA